MPSQLSNRTLVFFGDSLTDNGNIFALTGEVLTTPVPFDAAGYAQRFSDGPVYAEYAVDLLDPADSANFGIGAARAKGVLTLGQTIEERGGTGSLTVPLDDPRLEFDINIGGQIDRFLAENAGADLAGFTALVQIGANDYLNLDVDGSDDLVGDALGLMRDVVDATLDAVQRLADAGVGQIVVNTLPTAAFFPFNAESGDAELLDLAELVLTLHNSLLKLGLDDISGGAEITVVEGQSFTQELITDPATFGLIAPLAEYVVLEDGPGTPEFNPLLDGFDPDQIAFYDSVHPTTALHGILGAFQAESLTSDVAFLGDGTDFRLFGGADDLVFSADGRDILFARGGQDVVFSGLGDDLVFGGLGEDILAGGSGADRILGGADADVIAGNLGDDVLGGGSGHDILIGGLGSDRADGGRGDDLFFHVQASLIGGTDGVDADSYFGGTGEDTLYLVLDAATRGTVGDALASGPQTDALALIGVTASGIETVELLDTRAELALVDSVARLDEADLWGLV